MIPLNLICNIAMFWKSWTLTFWPHLLGSWRDEGEGSAGKIFATMLLHFVIPFNLICKMTMFWRSRILTFWPQPLGQGCDQRGVLCGYFHTYVGPGYFLGFKILISIFLGVLRKVYIFGGYEDFVDIFWGHHKIGLVWGSFLCISGYFFKVKVQNLDIFFVC